MSKDIKNQSCHQSTNSQDLIRNVIFSNLLITFLAQADNKMKRERGRAIPNKSINNRKLLTWLQRNDWMGARSARVLPVEPEVAPRLTEDGLIVVMDLLVADPARVDRRSIGVLGIEDHRLVGRVNLKLLCESGTYTRRDWPNISFLSFFFLLIFGYFLSFLYGL